MFNVITFFSTPVKAVSQAFYFFPNTANLKCPGNAQSGCLGVFTISHATISKGKAPSEILLIDSGMKCATPVMLKVVN